MIYGCVGFSSTTVSSISKNNSLILAPSKNAGIPLIINVFPPKNSISKPSFKKVFSELTNIFFSLCVTSTTIEDLQFVQQFHRLIEHS